MEVKDVPINKVKILENIRVRTRRQDLEELMRSIKQNGLLQPIGVAKEGKEYILIWGNRRFLSTKKLGWTKIPAVISSNGLTEAEFIVKNTIENIQREDITPIELGRICKRLREDGLSYGEISARLGIPKMRVESCTKLYTNVPKKFRKDIEFIPPEKVKLKGGRLSASLSDSIVRLRLTKDKIYKLFEYAKKHELTKYDVGLLARMIDRGATFRNAMKELKHYRVFVLHLVLNKHEEDRLKKKYNLVTGRIVNGMLKGELPLKRKFLW